MPTVSFLDYVYRFREPQFERRLSECRKQLNPARKSGLAAGGDTAVVEVTLWSVCRVH